jgi:capsular polysaccharide transport system permease protein
VGNFQINRLVAGAREYLAFTGSLSPPRVGLIDHLFILRALILRDLRLKHNHGIGFLIEFLRPVIVIVAHYYFFLVIKKPMPGNVPLEIYCISGFSVWYAFYYTCYAAMTSETRLTGAILIAGVTPMHFRLAKSAWALLFYLSFCFLCVVPLKLYGDDVSFPDVPLTVLVFLLAGAMGFGFGVLLEGLSRVWPVTKSLKNIFLWALFITCGIYFSISQTLQPILAEIFWYNPILHLVEYQRHAFDRGYPIVMVTLLYPAGVAGVLMFIGLMTNRCTRQLARD